jgi:hypothetical protein
MPNINISKLRADVLDRLDNSVVVQELSEPVRQKLKSTVRVTTAINQAIVGFCQQAEVSTVSDLVDIVSLSADPDVGTNGTVDKITTYKWPSDCFNEHKSGGLLNILLNGSEYDLSEGTMVSQQTVEYQANSSFHGPDTEVYAIDPTLKRIYIPEGVTAQARIIKYPEKVNNDNTYGSANDSVIPIPNSFFTTLSQMSVSELINSIGAGSTGMMQAEREVENSDEQ